MKYGRLTAVFLLLLCFGVSADMRLPLIRVETQLFKKIFFLDYDYENKLINGRVVFVLLYDTPKHREIAEKFREFLEGDRVLGRSISVHMAGKFLPEASGASAYIAILQKKRLQRFLPALMRQKRLVFVYDEALIEGGMIAVSVGARIVPLVNLNVLKKSGINLRPVFFRVAKVHDAQD